MTEAEKRAALYRVLVEESVKELSEIMIVSFKDMAKELAKKTLGRSVRTKDPMFWHAGMLMLGLAEARGRVLCDLNAGEDGQSEEAAGAMVVSGSGSDDGKREILFSHDEALELINMIDASVLGHLRLWREKFGGSIDFIDDALAGAACIRIYKQILEQEKGREKFDRAGLKAELYKAAGDVYRYLLDAPKDEMGTIVYNAGKSANIFADGVGQTAMFLAMYGESFSDPKASDMALLQLENYKKYGMDDRSGLCYHGYSIEEDIPSKKGVLSWGRAAGWLIMGLSEYARTSGADDCMCSWYEELSKVLLTYMRPDGGFSWQVQAIDGHLDTSATGMIVYGIVNAEAKINQNFLQTENLLWDNISEGRVMNALSSCDDFAVHYQTYGHYPWGQGAALMALSRII